MLPHFAYLLLICRRVIGDRRVITRLHSVMAHNFVSEKEKNRQDRKIEKRKQPSATHFCQLHISHVFDDVSGELDKDRLDREAPSILQTDPQKQADSESGAESHDQAFCRFLLTKY